MLSFDELNVLAGQNEQRSMDIDKFFDEMGISEEDKENRKAFARQLENDLFVVLAFLFMVLQNDINNGINMAKSMAEQAMLNAVNQGFVPDSAVILYAEDYANEFVDATIRNKGTVFTAETEEEVIGEYYFSQDRAKLNAENEANTIFNYMGLRQAVEDGMKYKKWNTMADERVRMTHAEIDGTIVPIDGTFDVGGYPMHYPHEMGAPAKEVIGCRCWLEYYKTI